MAAMLLLLGAAECKPQFWYVTRLGYFDTAPACTAHPEKSYNGAPWKSTHGSPVQDSSITFTVLDDRGQVVSKACLGGNYTVRISFPKARAALVSSSVGVFTSPKPTTGCPNRLDLGFQGRAKSTSYTAALLLPCTAPGSGQLRVTSSGSEHEWKQASASLVIDDSCYVGACATPGGASSPPPPPSTLASPSPPSVSPPPLSSPLPRPPPTTRQATPPPKRNARPPPKVKRPPPSKTRTRRQGH